METVRDYTFLGSKIPVACDCSHEIQRCLLLGSKVKTNLDKKQRHYFTSKGLYSQSYGFSSSHIWMWELDYKESWAPKNWCFWTVVLETTLESPLDCKEIQPVHPKGTQSWIFIGKTEAETPILWPPDGKNWHIDKDPDAGKDWRREEKGMTEDEMVGWHHWLKGHEFELTPGDREGQGSLACCSPWGHKEPDTTVHLNNKQQETLRLKYMNLLPKTTPRKQYLTYFYVVYIYTTDPIYQIVSFYHLMYHAICISLKILVLFTLYTI